MSDLETEELKKQLNADVERTKMIDGYSIKELMAASRGAERKFAEKILQLEETTGIEIHFGSALNGEVRLYFNPQSYPRLIEGYVILPQGGLGIADKVVKVIRYDEYIIDSNGNIKCVANNDDDITHEPQPKQEDIEKIKKFQTEFIAFIQECKNFAKTQEVKVPNTNLIYVLGGDTVALYYNPRKAYYNANGVSYNAQVEISTYPTDEGMKTYGTEEIIEDMSEFLDTVKVPRDSVPEILKENIGEKISILEKGKNDVITNSTHIITDYSPIKETLQKIVKKVRKMKKSKDKGEITNEQKSSTSGKEK